MAHQNPLELVHKELTSILEEHQNHHHDKMVRCSDCAYLLERIMHLQKITSEFFKDTLDDLPAFH